jgi:Sap, sulfolipid-1-addressing protein
LRPKARHPILVASSSGRIPRLKTRAERALKQGSLPVAAGVGAILGVPGPFDLLAVGHMARGGYTTIGLIGLIAAFNLVKFLLIELPIASYAVNPEGTAALVDRFAA